jgi:hypothetical protein
VFFQGLVAGSVVLAFFFGLSVLARAQAAGSGSITGTVMDTSKALLPQAQVTIHNIDTGATLTQMSNKDGIFSVQFLQPGHYEVTVDAAGFAEATQKNITLLVGQTLSLDFALPPKSVQSTVMVLSEVPMLDTEKTEASQTIGQKLITDLPVRDRRWDSFVLLTPNVAPDSDTGLISYRGLSGLYNSNQVDGTNNNQAFFSEARGRSIGSPYVYSQDSIQEFRSEAAGYSAEFGLAAGGQINAITKSGTNAMHGDLFYYLRYPSLNALDPLGKTQGIFTQPVHQQQQFGGSTGGPIVRDKLFYFFTYDGFREVNPILYTSSIPATTLATYACPAPITATQCSTAKAFLSAQVGAFSRYINQNIFFPKLDYQLNPTNHLASSFNWQDFKEPNGYNTSASSNNGSVTQNGTAYFHERFLMANWSTVLSNRSANEVRFQWSRDLETDTTNSPGPSVSIAGLSAYGETSALPRAAFPDEHLWELDEIFSTTRGKHTLKAGASMDLFHELLINLFQGDGGYSYSAGTTSASFSNWVQDVYQVNGGQHYNSFTQVNDPITGVGRDDFWNQDLSGFVEDAWKATNNLTLDLGLRYDIQVIPKPPRPNLTSGLSTYYTSTANIDSHEYQPRIGFAWQVMPKTVLRGGYGLYYGLTTNSTYYTLYVENGVYQQQYNINVGTFKTTANGQPAPGTYPSYAPVAPNVLFTPPGPPMAAPFVGAVTPQTVNTGAKLFPLAFRGLDPHFLNPYSDALDLAVEQQLPGQMTLSIGYVGNRGMRLPIFIDKNLAPATTTKTYDVVNRVGQTLGTVTLPFYTQRLTNTAQSFLVGFSEVNAWYNAMVVTLNKPFHNGLEIVANYTWAHAVDGGQVSGANGTFNGTDVPLDPNNLHAEYGRSDLDMRERFVGTLVYSPTVPWISDKTLRYIVNNWTYSGTATEQTGFPLTAFMANYPSGAPDGGMTGGDVSLFNGPTGGRAPQVPRNGFPGPGLRNIDFRVERNFPIYKQMQFQVLGEAFNVLNHENIFAVNTTAFTYIAPNTKAGSPCYGHGNGCIAPYTSQAFGAPTATSATIFGPRQLQVSARLFF